MSAVIAMGKHRKSETTPATMAKRAAGGVMIGAALTAGVSGTIGAATASAAPTCNLAQLCSGLPTASLVGDSGAGAVTQALVQANAAPGVPGLSRVAFTLNYQHP